MAPCYPKRRHVHVTQGAAAQCYPKAPTPCYLTLLKRVDAPPPVRHAACCAVPCQALLRQLALDTAPAPAAEAAAAAGAAPTDHRDLRKWQLRQAISPARVRHAANFSASIGPALLRLALDAVEQRRAEGGAEAPRAPSRRRKTRSGGGR